MMASDREVRDRVTVVSTPRWRDEWHEGEEARVRYVACTRARKLLVEVGMEDDVRSDENVHPLC